MPRLDLDVKAAKRLKARLRELAKAEGLATDDLATIVRAALRDWEQPLSMPLLAHRIEGVLREAHQAGTTIARKHLRADLEALIAPPAKKHDDPWFLLMASSATYLASYVGREVARARLAGTAPDPRYAKGSIVRAIGGAVFGGYNTTVHDMARAAKSRGNIVALRWDSTLDRLTCSRCRSLHGEVRRSWDDPPPAHPSCRCVLHQVEMPRPA
jgi:hypothetical protein